MSKELIIFTDGSCEPNPGDGSWAFVVLNGNQVFQRSCFEEKTTNNRMEMMAVIEALRFVRSKNLHLDSEVKLFVDSEYVAKGACLWIHNWKKKGMWKNRKEQVKNADLWLELNAECAAVGRLSFSVVRGHTGVYGNELVDELCTMAWKKKCGSVSDRALDPGENFKTVPRMTLGFLTRQLPELKEPKIDKKKFQLRKYRADRNGLSSEELGPQIAEFDARVGIKRF